MSVERQRHKRCRFHLKRLVATCPDDASLAQGRTPTRRAKLPFTFQAVACHAKAGPVAAGHDINESSNDQDRSQHPCAFPGLQLAVSAGGPVVVVEEGQPEVVAESPRSGWIVPVIVGLVLVCAIACGDDNETTTQP